MKARFALEDIKKKLYRKELTYDEAEKEATPHLKEMNEAMARVAKRHGKRHYNVSFTKMMR